MPASASAAARPPAVPGRLRGRRSRDRRAPFHSRYTEVSGHRVHARVSAAWGDDDAVPVVLVHGLAGSSGAMMRTARLLPARHPVAAIDLPGHGRSSRPPTRRAGITDLADGLAAWLAANDAGPVAIVGASFGCQVVIDVALRHPGSVDRIVLLGLTGDIEGATLPRLVGRLLVDATREPVLVPAVALGVRHTGLRRVLHTARCLVKDPVEEKLPRLSAPTLIVRGTRDAVVPDAWARRTARLVPGATFVELPGAAHAANYSAPARFVTAVSPFLARPSARA